MIFKLEIDCDNAAFSDPFELPRILNNVAQVLSLAPGQSEGTCTDANGNHVGDWRFTNE